MKVPRKESDMHQRDLLTDARPRPTVPPGSAALVCRRLVDTPCVRSRTKPGTDHGFLVSTLVWQLKLIVVGCLFPRSSGPAGPGTAADDRGDLPLETLAAEREPAVGRIPNGFKNTGDRPRLIRQAKYWGQTTINSPGKQIAQLAPRPDRPLPRRRYAPARQRAAGQA
jgi:hypothetical protein